MVQKDRKDIIVTNITTLKQISRPTTQEEVDKLNLKERLKYMNDQAWTRGCGMAAIQIGIPLRYAWFTHHLKEYELLNPEILLKMGSYTKYEGCLSIPERYENTIRYHQIEYITHGKKRKAKGLKACIIQHEIDHMDGILYTDRRKNDKTNPDNRTTEGPKGVST